MKSYHRYLPITLLLYTQHLAIKKAEELGFETIDIAIACLVSFPTELVKQELAKTNLQVVNKTT